MSILDAGLSRSAAARVFAAWRWSACPITRAWKRWGLQATASDSLLTPLSLKLTLKRREFQRLCRSEVEVSTKQLCKFAALHGFPMRHRRLALAQ